MARPPSPVQKPMVGWYAPTQLAKTGIEVAISTIFGRHSDHRLVEAMASGDDVPGDAASIGGVSGVPPGPFYDYTHHHLDDGKTLKRNLADQRKEIWIDYVGDVGDGWNPTYAIAHYLADPAGLTFNYKERESGKEKSVKTERGTVLIFGGDEVYPTASRQEYDERLLVPYQTALRNSPEEAPHVFALPGNHDWYDSLVSFTRLFTAREWFAGWRTRQSRSYFALKLPHNWWLLGTDVQLGSDIDKPQMDYFKGLTAEMERQFTDTGEHPRIILCHAEPHWIRAAQYGGEGEDPNYTENNLKALESKLGRNVAVFIAGDLHHYRRYESEDKSTQKITAGGGGAFLHPTHVGLLGKSLDKIVEIGPWDNVKKKRELRNFKLEGCFPSTKDSFWACFGNLMFPFFAFQRNKSWTFGFVTAALYWLIGLSLLADIDEPKFGNIHFEFGTVTGSILSAIVNSPATLFFVFATVLGFIFFTDTHRWYHRLPMGGVHAIAHVLAAFTIALLSVFFIPWPPSWRYTLDWGGYEFHPDLRLVLASCLIMFGGYIVGSFIMGVYLLGSFNLFNRHGNEAFSSLGIEDWKNFIRLHINEKGDLTIYPIGIRRVPRKWKDRDGGAGPEKVSDDPKATMPELIELPIKMERDAHTETGVVTTSLDTKIDSEAQSSAPES